MKTPYLPHFDFYVADWLLSRRVSEMSFAQRGLYLHLMCLSWRNGNLPADPDRLARLAGCSREEFDSLWVGPLSECFTQREGSLINDRLEIERAKAIQRSDAARANGKLGHAARYGDRSGDRQQSATPTATNPPQQRSGETLASHQSPVTSHHSGESSEAKPRSPAKPKAQPSGEHAEFIAWWCAAFQEATGAPYGFQGGKDGSHVKRILERAGGASEARKRATLLLASAPEWIARGGIDLGTLDTQWNKLVSAGAVGVATGSKQLALQSLNGNERTIPKLAPLPTTKGGFR